MNQSESCKNINKPIMRQSNIELLRIIAMLLIVGHHFSYHSGFDFPNTSITVNRLWIQFIEMGGKIGVDIFVLISGYFLISAKNSRTNKVIKLLMQILTYSILIFILFVTLCGEPFSLIGLVQSCFPVTFSVWWFASAYFVLYLISPFINRLLNALDKKEYQSFLVLLTICWCIIPTFTTKGFQSNPLLWFVYLYSLAGYIKIHSRITNIKKLPAISFSLAAVVIVLTFLSAVCFDVIGIKIPYFAENAAYFYGMQRLPTLITSVSIFIGFLKINIGCSRIINVIASATFGVYLIHDNGYVRPFLWKTIFKCASHSEDSVLIPYSLLVIAIVFIACTIIELLRIYVFEKHYMKLINSLAGLIDKYKEKLFSLSVFDKL